MQDSPTEGGNRCIPISNPPENEALLSHFMGMHPNDISKGVFDPSISP